MDNTITSDVERSIKSEVASRYEKYKDLTGMDSWNKHVKHVVDHAVKLAATYGADIEITELGALLHDISLASPDCDRDAHHIESAAIAENLLLELDYPKDKIERVKQCILNHRGSKVRPKNSLEEQCVADADALAHFAEIPGLFYHSYVTLGQSEQEGSTWIKSKLERDIAKLSERTREAMKERFEAIINIVFGEK